MEYHNLKEANEIDFAITYLKEIRTKVIKEMREKEKQLGVGVITDVVNNFSCGLVDLENKEVDRLKKRLREL